MFLQLILLTTLAAANVIGAESDGKVSIGYPRITPEPVWVIGTYGKKDKPELTTTTSGGICGGGSPCIVISFSKQDIICQNILHSKAFTVNVPSQDFVDETDYLGMSRNRNLNPFKIAGLTPVKSKLVKAPYIKEFPLNIECKLVDAVDINDFTIFVGSVAGIKANKDIVFRGKIKMRNLDTFFLSPSEKKYYGLGSRAGRKSRAGGKYKNDK